MNASSITAYASSLAWDMLGDFDNSRQYGTTCSVEGCGASRELSKPSARGRFASYGFCPKHFRSFARSGGVNGGGDPLGVKHKAREVLLSAVHALGDEPESADAQVALGEAVIAYRGSTVSRMPLPHEPGAGISGERGAELRSAALAYTEHDAEAPLSDFLVASQRLEAAVAAFATPFLRAPAPRLRVAPTPATEMKEAA